MVEQLLVEYDIAIPRYLQQAELIGLLITDLYTDAPELGDTPGEYADYKYTLVLCDTSQDYYQTL